VSTHRVDREGAAHRTVFASPCPVALPTLHLVEEVATARNALESRAQTKLLVLCWLKNHAEIGDDEDATRPLRTPPFLSRRKEGPKPPESLDRGEFTPERKGLQVYLPAHRLILAHNR